jgi:hypothetical protein
MNKLVELAARLLEPDERDAVLGDLAEAGEGGVSTLLGVLGLVARRQAGLWGDWRPWLALVGLVGLVAPRLWNISSGLGMDLFMNIRTYWSYGSLNASGMTVSEEVVLTLCQLLGLVFWSWISGFVLGALSRRTIWTTGTLYYFHLWLYPLSAAWYAWKFGSGHYSALPMLLLEIVIQMALYAALFMMPSLIGLRQGLGKVAIGGWHAYLIAGVSVCLTVLAVWTGGWPHAAVARWGGGAWDPSAGWPERLLFFGVLSWPAGYLVARAAFANRANSGAGTEFPRGGKTVF